MEKIIGAAIKIENGMVYIGTAHFLCVELYEKQTGKGYLEKNTGKVVEGFMTSEGRFVTKREAIQIAKQEQLDRHKERKGEEDDGELDSEDFEHFTSST